MPPSPPRPRPAHRAPLSPPIDVPLRSNKPVLLAARVRARAAAPDVPRPTAATAAAAAGGGGEALIAHTDGVRPIASTTGC